MVRHASQAKSPAIKAVVTMVFRWFGLRDGYDETRPADYTADPVPAPAAAAETRIPATPGSLARR